MRREVEEEDEEDEVEERRARAESRIRGWSMIEGNLG